MNPSRGFISLGLILGLAIALAVLGGVGWWASHQHSKIEQINQTATTTETASQVTLSPYANQFRMEGGRDALTLLETSKRPSAPYAIVGWTLRSRSTGFIYTVPAMVYTKNSYKGVPAASTSDSVMIYPNSGEFIVVHSGGRVSDNLVHETEIVAYHLYTGTTTPWGEHDTIDLFDAQGLLVSLLTY